MLINENGHESHEQYEYKLPKKSLQIKEDNSFFSRLLSKETSIANSSCRVYYGEAGAVPFVWELQPGTPKHPLSEIYNPPLTPPPSYSSTNSKNKSKTIKQSRVSKAGNSTIFPKLNVWSKSRKLQLSPSSSFSSSNSWASLNSSVSSLTNKKVNKRRCFSADSSHPFVYDIRSVECDGSDSTSPNSTLCISKERKNKNGVFGRCSIGKVKCLLLSVLGHGFPGRCCISKTTA